MEFASGAGACHSREGGNPFGFRKETRTMDSRLRGNDKLKSYELLSITLGSR
jgi:hypothetical protein